MSEQAMTHAARSEGAQTKPASGLLQRTAITPIVHGVLQRCSNGVECPECRERRLQQEGTLQRAAVNAAPTPAVPPIVHDVLNSPGHPLDIGTRAFMEPRFGHDFSGVKVHTDARAAESARAVNALAYTVGNNVVFGSGQYLPETMTGKRLLAHELTHVVQQGTVLEGRISKKEELVVGQVNDSYEQEAERNSLLVNQDTPSSVMPPQLHRSFQGVGNLIQRKIADEERSVSLPTSGGAVMQDDVRKSMEEHFHTSFSNVNVHTDKRAGASALEMGAQAFTHGHNIYFAPNQYQPGTQKGRGLLAHELTHVVQQRNGRFTPNTSTGRTVSANNALENEAKSTQRAVSSSAPVQVKEAEAGNTIHRSILDDIGSFFFNNIEEAVDFVLAHMDIENDRIISKLNQLRIEIKNNKERFVRLAMNVVADLEALFHRLKSYAPSWIPIPDISFGGPMTQQAAPLLAIPVAAIILFIAFCIVMMWYLQRLNPVIRRQQDKAIEDIIDRIREGLRGKPEEAPQEEPETKPQEPAKPQEEPQAKPKPQEPAKPQEEPQAKPKPQEEPQSKPQEQPKPKPKPKPDIDDPVPPRRCRGRSDSSCPVPLSVNWPRLLPNPEEWPDPIPSFENNGLMRTGEETRDSSGVGIRGNNQRRFAERINAALRTGTDLPTPCFQEEVPIGPNDKFHAHHIHPLFLGGEDDEENLCALHVDAHVKGHGPLNNQIENFPEYLGLCNMCSPFLTQHPEEQTYVITGEK